MTEEIIIKLTSINHQLAAIIGIMIYLSVVFTLKGAFSKKNEFLEVDKKYRKERKLGDINE